MITAHVSLCCPGWYQAAQRGAQFIIATHSPILLAAPGADIVELGESGFGFIEDIKATSVHVFATETLALGINMPARTVILEKLVKFNGEAHVDLTGLLDDRAISLELREGLLEQA